MFDGYILCGTPRTGSTLLCDLLASTGRTGRPDSFFRRENIAEWADEWRLPKRETMTDAAFEIAYLRAANMAGRGETAMFGMRLMRENVDELSAMLDRIYPQLLSDRARLERAFGKLCYIHLSRADKLAQAVSLVKAEQTGLWHIAPDGTEIERLAPAAEPRYDFRRLKHEVTRLDRFDAAWNAWFEKQGVVPHRVTYERLSIDPAATVIDICEALGAPPPKPEDIRPGVAKLADDISLEWIARYRSDIETASGADGQKS